MDLFSGEGGEGFETKSVTDTRATTDKNDPFLNMLFKHGKKVSGQTWAKCNMGFGRITKNTCRAHAHSSRQDGELPEIGIDYRTPSPPPPLPDPLPHRQPRHLPLNGGLAKLAGQKWRFHPNWFLTCICLLFLLFSF